MNGASSLARAALLIAAAAGLLHGISGLYWAFGGTAMLDSIGEVGASGDAQIRAFFAVVGPAKTLAAVIPLLLLHPRPPLRRTIRVISWVGGVFLILLGITTIVMGGMELTDASATATDAERHGLIWTTFFWHPLFSVWGVSLVTALAVSGRPRQSAD